MKKLLIFLLLCTTYCTFAENVPSVYFQLGTEKNEILYKLGNPKIVYNDFTYIYETYTDKKTTETITFMFNEQNKLSAIFVDIGLDYGSTILSPSDYIKQVMTAYYNEYVAILGKPLVESAQGCVWKFDDGFCVFYPETVNTFLRFRFNIINRDSAKGTQFESLYQ